MLRRSPAWRRHSTPDASVYISISSTFTVLSACRVAPRRKEHHARAPRDDLRRARASSALSHAPVPRSADPIARAAQLLPTARASLVAAGHVFREDRAALGALAASGVLACQALPRLFRDLAQLRATGARGSPTSPPATWRARRSCARLRARDARLAELLCGMQLAAPLVATALADRTAPRPTSTRYRARSPPSRRGRPACAPRGPSA